MPVKSPYSSSGALSLYPSFPDHEEALNVLRDPSLAHSDCPHLGQGMARLITVAAMPDDHDISLYLLSMEPAPWKFGKWV